MAYLVLTIIFSTLSAVAVFFGRVRLAMGLGLLLLLPQIVFLSPVKAVFIWFGLISIIFMLSVTIKGLARA